LIFTTVSPDAVAMHWSGRADASGGIVPSLFLCQTGCCNLRLPLSARLIICNTAAMAVLVLDVFFDAVAAFGPQCRLWVFGGSVGAAAKSTTGSRLKPPAEMTMPDTVDLDQKVRKIPMSRHIRHANRLSLGYRHKRRKECAMVY
jgi:hypothetical protein